MTQTHPLAEAAYAFFSHARFARALSLITIGSALGAQMLRSLLGPAGLSAVFIAELLLTAAMLLARRRVVKWSVFIPVSLAVFLGWLVLSSVWTYYPKASIAGISSQLTFTALALGVAATRDTIQIVRAVGDVLRVFLAASLVLEIFSGVLIDTPIAFLGIIGNLMNGNGIQGIFGSRNALSVIALIALITFFIEWRTKSVTRELSIWSMLGAAVCLYLGSSPVGLVTLLGVGFVAVLLFILRTMEPAARRGAEIGVGIAGVLAVIAVWVFRGSVLEALSNSGPLQYRLALWSEEWRLATMKFLDGWGWTGLWPRKTQPFTVMNSGSGDVHYSGLNIFLDTWLQLGLVGLVLLLMLLGIAFTRSWALATAKKSEIYLWAPLVLSTLLISGLAESNALTEWGWFFVVLIVARTSAELSWRRTKD
ncbi:exopolysaccharide production protein ExoQ [Aurantimicrobium minutum]|uniref:hypothetical protein n=1 Tax=Aurantimicrobium minutum TaxID=708131 RepID=UPI002473C99B|nr:hypothetical protein [Aurantimicrobium minutum]MDH6531828.1 exopolysaccharide production protein ExoQ [Aurantimicrobium minutum]